MDCNSISMHDLRNANTIHFSSSSGNPPPLKRMRHSLSSSLDMNDNSSMEYDNKIINAYDYRTDQSVEYQTETSISQDMMTCSSTCNSTVYPRSNPDESLMATKPILQTDGDCERTSMRHKRRLHHAGSNTLSSCSTHVSLSSTLTEISLMDDIDDDDDNNNNIVVINDIAQEFSSPKFLLDSVYREGIDTESSYDKNDCTNEIVDTMMMDSVVYNWDQDFVLHAPTIYHTDRRTKAQVKQAKRSIHRRHFNNSSR